MKLSNIRPWFLFMIMAAFAFGSIISFFQIDSYWADKNNANWLFWVTGIVSGLIAIYCLHLVNKKAGSGRGDGK